MKKTGCPKTFAQYCVKIQKVEWWEKTLVKMSIFQIHVQIIPTPTNFKKIEKKHVYFKHTATNSKLDLNLRKLIMKVSEILCEGSFTNLTLQIDL